MCRARPSFLYGAETIGLLTADYQIEDAKYQPEHIDWLESMGMVIPEEDEALIVDRDSEVALLASEFSGEGHTSQQETPGTSRACSRACENAATLLRWGVNRPRGHAQGAESPPACIADFDDDYTAPESPEYNDEVGFDETEGASTEF